MAATHHSKQPSFWWTAWFTHAAAYDPVHYDLLRYVKTGEHTNMTSCDHMTREHSYDDEVALELDFRRAKALRYLRDQTNILFMRNGRLQHCTKFFEPTVKE